MIENYLKDKDVGEVLFVFDLTQLYDILDCSSVLLC